MRLRTAISLLVCLWPSVALASQVTLFENSYERSPGQPNEYDDTFALPSDVEAPYLLTASGPPNPQVTLNGETLHGNLVDVPVTLSEQNTLHVRLTGQRGTCTITVTGEEASGPPPGYAEVLPPTLLTRVPGAPEETLTEFDVSGALTGPFTLRIESGSASGRFRVTSASVTLDGTEILGPSSFSPDVGEIEQELSLEPGPHTLGVRLAGRPGTYLVVSMYGGAPPVEGLSVVSGDGQTGIIRTALATPLVVKVTGEGGNPLPGQRIYWKVVRGDGAFSDGSSQKIVETDSQGEAQVTLTLGSHQGEEMNEVEATSPGFGRVFLTADALPSLASQIHPWRGERQRGLAGQAAPEPLECSFATRE